MAKKWYVVTTYSGYENKVREYLERRIDSMGLQEIIERVVVPEVEEVLPDGKVKMKKLFPGYVLVQMDITDDAWYIVRNTPNVTGFVGSSGGGAKPIPLLEEEVEHIFQQMGLTRINVDYAVGDMVEIIDGPLKGNTGLVKVIDLDKNHVEVATDLFGRETDTTLELNQVKKI